MKKEEPGMFLWADPPNVDVLIYKIVNENANIIYKYIKSRNIVVNGISTTSNLAGKYKSFKISIPKFYLATLLNLSFWPDSVKYKKLIEPNAKNVKSNIFIGKNYRNIKC